MRKPVHDWLASIVVCQNYRETNQNGAEQKQKIIRMDRVKLLAVDYPRESSPLDRSDVSEFDNRWFRPECSWARRVVVPSVIELKPQTRTPHASPYDSNRRCNRHRTWMHSTHSTPWHYGKGSLHFWLARHCCNFVQYLNWISRRAIVD